MDAIYGLKFRQKIYGLKYFQFQRLLIVNGITALNNTSMSR